MAIRDGFIDQYMEDEMGDFDFKNQKSLMAQVNDKQQMMQQIPMQQAGQMVNQDQVPQSLMSQTQLAKVRSTPTIMNQGNTPQQPAQQGMQNPYTQDKNIFERYFDKKFGSNDKQEIARWEQEQLQNWAKHDPQFKDYAGMTKSQSRTLQKMGLDNLNKAPAAMSNNQMWMNKPESYKSKYLFEQQNKSQKPLVSINQGSAPPSYQKGTPEQNEEYGYPKDKPTHWEAKGGTMVLKPNIIETEASRKAKTYYNDMVNAQDNFDILQETYPDFNPGEVTDNILRTIAGMDGPMGMAANMMQSDASQQFLAPMMTWVSANRAYVSGAVVPEVEFTRDVKTYFPSAGDSPETIALKKAMREQRTETLADSVGLPAAERQRLLRKTANEDYKKMMKAKRDLKKANKTRKPTAPAVKQPSFEDWKKSKGY